jgi:hypothetical protein
MGGVETGLLTIAAGLELLAEGIGALCLVGCGFYYMMARGNPRGQGQAFSWLVDVGKGMILVTGAVAVTQFLLGALKFS